MKVRSLYEGLSAIGLLAVFAQTVLFWIISTINGLNGRGYSIMVYTDKIGENYIELALLLIFLPGAIWLSFNGALARFRSLRRVKP